MNTTQEDTTTDTRMYPALKLMERTTPPLRYGREPLWRSPLPHAIDAPLIPSWNWHAVRDFVPGTETVVLDANGAYLSAMGQTSISHSQLIRTGPIEHYPDPRTVAPGYYKITVPHWAFSGTIVSPLGDSARIETDDHLWIAHPTLILLLELAAEGHIGAFDILDAYTTTRATSFKTWYEKLRAVRTQCLDQIESVHRDGRPSDDDKCKCTPCVRYNAFKEGYSAALSMMLTGNKCKTQRPDWSQAVYATHSATMWRKAWRYTGTNKHLVSMGHVDELQILRDDLQDALDRTSKPFRFDASGRSLGAMKVKRYGQLEEPAAPPRTGAVPGSVEAWEEIL
jgi:hypothetical protein